MQPFRGRGKRLRTRVVRKGGPEAVPCPREEWFSNASESPGELVETDCWAPDPVFDA